MQSLGKSRFPLYFITDKLEIKDELLKMGLKEKSSDMIDKTARESLRSNIETRQPDFCRGSGMFPYLLENMTDDNEKGEKNTIIFIHGGDKVLGLVNFYVDKTLKVIITRGICVPQGPVKELGKKLIDTLKEFGGKLGLNAIRIFALKSARPFYERNGLNPEIELGWGWMAYNFKDDSHQGGTNKIKSKAKKNKSNKTLSSRMNKTKRRIA